MRQQPVGETQGQEEEGGANKGAAQEAEVQQEEGVVLQVRR